MQSRSKTCDQAETRNALFMTSAFWWLVLMYSMRISSTEKASQVLATLMRWNLAKCLGLGLKPLAIIASTAWLSSYTLSTEVEAILLWQTARKEMASPNSAALRATNSAPVVDLETALWDLDPQRMTANESGPWRAKIEPLVDFISGDKPKSPSTSVKIKPEPQLSWRVIDTHDMSIINGGSDVANETSCSLIVSGTPSCDMTCKCVDCNHEIWATDPTKPHQFHDKFCGWRGKLSYTFIVGLNKGIAITMRSAKVLDLLAGELFIKLNTLPCKVCSEGQDPLILRNMIPTK